MIEITIKEDSGRLIINEPALSLLKDDEYSFLRALAQALKERVKENKK